MVVERFFFIFLILFAVNCFDMPSCNNSQYFDPSLMSCQSCPLNVSMTSSVDGFACTCKDHSVPIGAGSCKQCNATELVSSDGKSCVPRRCQSYSGKFVCRKCPNDYIAVTQNFDGSPMKEVLCVKCARGYKAKNNVCVKCETCTCSKKQMVVKDVCVPKVYLTDRPKYDETKLLPSNVLDFVKSEYLCTQNDLRACRRLSSECVRNLYTTDMAGPCRLWLQRKLVPPTGLPQLTLESTSADKNPGEITLKRGKDIFLLASAIYTSDGGFKLFEDIENKVLTCLLPIKIKIGSDITYKCNMNVTKLPTLLSESTFGIYLITDGEYKPIPIFVRKPNGYFVMKETWPSNKFRQYFLVNQAVSTAANVTTTTYLQTLIIKISIQRDKYRSGSLRGRVLAEVHYAIKSLPSDLVTTYFKVEHEVPSAGIIKGLEVWGGVLGSFLTLYALVQWRGNLRRGGLHFTIIPLLGGTVADALHFAAWFSTLHALAAEAGTLGITLPLSQHEESTIRAFVYSAVSLKFLKVAWFNWNQCRSDIFLLDWSEYNSPFEKDVDLVDKSKNWKAVILGREWGKMQTERRVSPAYTVTLTLLFIHVMMPWQSYIPPSQGYKWAMCTISWWSAYSTALLVRIIIDKIFGSPTEVLPRICNGLGLSLLVFQEECYAHYVHGRNEDSKDVRTMAGPLSTCRVVVSPQLRYIYKQLSNSDSGISFSMSETRHTLLTQFLATFFERALDGLNWVASERTVLERLLDVELTVRESGSTSVLLYDPDVSTPSCSAVTWWGEEWTLATFDAMVFSAVIIAANNPLLAALVTLSVWQIMKHTRSWFGIKNQRKKTGIDVPLV